MRGIRLAAGMMVVGLLAWTTPARAQDADVVRLNLNSDSSTTNLLDDGKGADTIAAWRGGFRAGGFAAGGFRAGGWGGYRGWGYGGYRGGWGWGGYRGAWGWGGRGWGWGYGGYYPYYGVGYGYGGYGFFPCVYGPTEVSVTTLAMPAVSTTIISPAVEVSPAIPATPPPAASEPTFPYDGGPANPVPTPRPMPRADQPPASPSAAPTPMVPLEGRAVALPRTGAKWTFPAYGEAPRRTTDAQDGKLVIRK